MTGTPDLVPAFNHVRQPDTKDPDVCIHCREDWIEIVPGDECHARIRIALDALAAENAELRATLENERGEGEGPSEGWTFMASSLEWAKDYPDGARGSAFLRNDGDPPTWLAWSAPGVGSRGVASTVREAMEASDATLSSEPR